MPKTGNGASRKLADAGVDGSAASTGNSRVARKKRRLEDADESEENSTSIADENKRATSRNEEDDDAEKIVQQPKKRARFKSPEGKKIKTKASKAKQEDDGAPHDSEMEDQEDSQGSNLVRTSESQAPAAAVASANNASEHSTNNKIPSSSTSAAASKPPLPEMRIPSHQTPGKFNQDNYRRLTATNDSSMNTTNNEIQVPTRQLMFGNTPTSSSNAAAPAAASGFVSSRPQPFNGTSNNINLNDSDIVQQPHPLLDRVVPPPPLRRSADPLGSTLVWFGIFCILTMMYTLLIQSSVGAMLPTSMSPSLGVVSTADHCLDGYKRLYYQYYPPPTREVINQTRVEEIKRMDRERHEHQQLKRKLLKDLQDAEEAMEREIMSMEKTKIDMKRNVRDIEDQIKNHSEPIVDVYERISRIDNLLEKAASSKEYDETVKALPEIKKALSEPDRDKLLDLSSLDLWEIPEMPESCLVEEEDDDEEEEEDPVEEHVDEDDDEEEEEDEEDEEDDDDDDEEEEEEVEEDYDEEEFAIANEDADDETMEVAVPFIDMDRLEDWSQGLQELIDNSTDDILKDDEVADQIRQWIRSELKEELGWEKALSEFTIEKLASQIVKKERDEVVNEMAKGGGSLQSEAIQAQIDERLELEIADQTGLLDFASIRNGASVVREGPRATSPSLAQSLPYFNRMMAHVGLRFYGHGAEAALTPTNPPDALGQCWSFMGEEATKKKRKSKVAQDFSRGSVATLTVRLARPIFVHSVVIEHPPKEITDRMDSAIRVFRVVGYEDKIGSKGSYELGRFEYKPDEGPRAEFGVARKLSRREVPKLRSIALAIESTWGKSDDYGCLYRFRVHGDDNE